MALAQVHSGVNTYTDVGPGGNDVRASQHHLRDGGKVGPGVAHIEKSDRDVVEAAAGNRGLTTLVDRKTGVIVAISYWDDLRRSSEAGLTKAREGAAEAAGGALSPKLRNRRRRTAGGARPWRDGADDAVSSTR